ncbi:MAG: DUF4147 domain-containing protein [Acidimicrobiales bacterium]
MENLALAKGNLGQLWWAGVHAVRGRPAVQNALISLGTPKPDRIVAVGKAAAAMSAGALDHFGTNIPTLIITKTGHARDVIQAEVIESSHPVPDRRSIAAGTRLREVVSQCGGTDHLLVLVSGGASSLAELPTAGTSLDDIATATSQLIAGGADIHQINSVRRELSQLKGGGLLSNFIGGRVTVLAISDVRGDDIEVIGSGIGVVPAGLPATSDTTVIASNTHARNAVAAAAESRGLTVLTNEENLHGQVGRVAALVGETLSSGGPGLHILGGEPTVELPPNPGRGGRNQHLAVLLSRELAERGSSTTALVAGTDGTDGPTDDAGGWADALLWSAEARTALETADTGTFLDRSHMLFTTGPTGTNVMDLVVAVSEPT